jgi:hypothetical protein
VNDLGTDVSGFGKDSTIAEQVADLIRSRGGEAIANDSNVSSLVWRREHRNQSSWNFVLLRNLSSLRNFALEER